MSRSARIRPWLSMSVVAAVGAVGCRAELPRQAVPVEHIVAPVFVNGDLESDAIATQPPTGWTVVARQNRGITDTRPSAQTVASLNLMTGGYLATKVVGAATPESVADPDLGAAATFRYPRYGTRAAVVNYLNTTNKGHNYNANIMSQTMTTTNADVDAADNKIHIRFAVAPVLESGGHPYNQQPYYFVVLENITKGTTMYQDFNASAQAGVPWKTATSGSGSTIYYTDWQLVDIAPGNVGLAVGDQVKLTVIAAGCSQSGHFGRAYVDGIGSTVPGLYTWATGPTSANQGENITYVVNYRNGGTGAAGGSAINMVIPTGTTYQSNSLPSACTAPAVGATGTVTCALGLLAPGSSGTFTVTVKVNAGTSGTTITNGNYSIQATSVSALLGPKVLTSVTASVAYSDVSITNTDGVAAVGWGQPLTYQMVVSNAGPGAAPTVTIADTFPAQLTGVTWVCSGAGGGTCNDPSGSGNMNTGAALPAGTSVTYTVSATVVAGTGTGSILNNATATVSGASADPDTSNNSAVDTNSIGVLRTVTLNKTNANGGTVTSVPASIACGTACASASGQFVDGTQVVLTAAPVSGAAFTTWGGACTGFGSMPSCTLTISGDVTASAAFTAPPTVNIITGNNQGAAMSTAFATPLVVRVLDSSGTPMVGSTVLFTVPSTGASVALSATSAVTDVNGDATVTATANATAGAYSVVAGLSGTPTTATFSLWNYGAAATLTIVSGTPQSTLVNTAFAAPLVVRVIDTANQPVPGVAVSFASSASSGASGTFTGSPAVTGANGQASVTATANGSAGNWFAVASGGGAPVASFAMTNTVGAAAAVATVTGGGQATIVGSAFATPLVVVVTDAGGNPVPGATVTFSAPSSGASATLSSVSVVTGSDGRATITATANGTAGSYAVTASISGGAAVSLMMSNTPALSISPTSVAVPPNGSATFTASGGSGMGYTFAVVSAPSGGSINAATGAYRAGATPAVTDTVTVTDSLGATATATITVGSGINLNPSTVTVAPRGTVAFAATGGAGSGYTYSVTTNLSGGSIDSSGAYRAGAVGNVSDVVTVHDPLGNTTTATVTVSAPLGLMGSGTTSPPRGSRTFSTTGGSGTGVVYTFATNASNGALNMTTGAYTAGAIPSVTDVVTATDSLGNTATATVAVGPGVSLTPTGSAVAPLAPLQFVASGGSGTGFTYTFVTNASMGTIGGSTGNYVAGSVGSAVDVVKATDSLGNTATVSVAVGAGLSLTPDAPTVAPGQTVGFEANGGSGSGYQYQLATNNSGGTINASSGAYQAGTTPNVTDTIDVVDSLGNRGTTTVHIGPPVAISPASLTLAPKGSGTFTVSGGSGSGYVFSLSSNASGGTVDATTGVYTAGSIGGVTDVVRVVDSLGRPATATITVTAALVARPSFYILTPQAGVTPGVSGGAGGNRFSLVTNGSGGSIDAVTGAYVAGSTGDTTDTILVRDRNGSTTTILILVGPGVLLDPPTALVAPMGALSFVASGGSGMGFRYTITSNASGGAIDAETGEYFAGPGSGVIDEVTATDSLGNTAAARVVVGNGLLIEPAAPRVPPRGSLTFSATGGSGTGYRFSLESNNSNGTIDADSGLYRAGTVPNVDDQVTVIDSLGNSGVVTVSVGDALTLTPAQASLAPRGTLQFTAQGGSGNGVRFLLSTNASGGQIDPDTGAYVAGSIPSVTDQITVSDDVGNQATALVHLGTGLVIDPPMVTVTPRATVAFKASGGGGGYTFTLRQNGSGATVASTSGLYAAGPRAGTRDVIEVQDGLGNAASAMVSVGGGLTVTPAAPEVAIAGSATFVAGGGSGGYTFTLTMNGSGGSINAATGAYTAGSNNGVDTVTVTDSAGNTAVVNVAVGLGLAINPGAPAAAPGETLTFVARGGSGSGYGFKVSSNTSNATIDSASGRYVAGPQGSVIDTVTVTDSGGNTASAAVQVGPGLALTPPQSSVAPATAIRFVVSGGSGTGNVFAVPTNATNAIIDADRGNYRAGPKGKVTDTVTVTDSLGMKDSATVTTGDELKVTPATATVPPRGTLDLVASGGAGEYAFTLSQQSSGGTVTSSSGAYRAGKTANVTDVVTLKDGNDVVTTVTITVGPGVAVTPATTTVSSGSTVSLTASGGSGTGYAWTLAKNRSNASIDASGKYTAGRVDGVTVTDSIQVTDSLGNIAIASIEVVRARNIAIGGGSGCECAMTTGAGNGPLVGGGALFAILALGLAAARGGRAKARSRR